MPAIDRSRYYSVQLCDATTYNYGYIGTRATGIEAGDYLVAGPDWKGATPPGIKKVFRSATQFASRSFARNSSIPADIDNVKRCRRAMSASRCPRSCKQPAPPAAPAIDFPKIDKELAKTNFFEFLDFALQFAPARPTRPTSAPSLRSIGVGPGRTFYFKELAPGAKARGGPRLEGRVEERSTRQSPASGRIINGWNVSGAPGDSAHFNGDWLLRAVAAQAGIYGNSAEEAMYPFTRKDVERRDTRRGQARYTLTFRGRPVAARERVLVGDDV